MPWGSVRGHDEQVRALRSAMAGGRFPHALFFAGPEGVGKALFARTLAQALLCETNPEAALDPCGRCPSCLQVANRAHPDVLFVARPEDKADLPIRSIRDLCIDLGLKPMRGSRRVAIVEDADDLTDEAANAFLKTLEEPPPGSILILVGTDPEGQLDTILSRCRLLRFEPLAESELAAILRETGAATDPETAGRLARLGEGSVGRALARSEPDLGAFRRSMIDDLAAPGPFDAPAFARKLEAFSKEAGKEASAQRARSRVLIGELARFLRSVLWQTAGVEPPTADDHDRVAAEQLASRVEPEDVFLMAERCLDADYQVQRNANRSLVFESLARDLGKAL